MAHINNFDLNEWIYLSNFPQTAFLQSNEFSFDNCPNFTAHGDTTSANTPSSSDTLSGTQLGGTQTPQSKRRRHTSVESESAAVTRTRKTRILRAPQETAKIREKGACFLCQKKRKEVKFAYQFEDFFFFRVKLITLK